jgi:hypothetical protein
MANIPVKIAGGCPKCGNPAVVVPEDYKPDTIIKCPSPECGFEARWEDFFKDS